MPEPYLAFAFTDPKVHTERGQRFVDVEVPDENGDEKTLTLPTRIDLCDRCQGEGTHTNPAVDGHGISAEEFAEDPDFKEDYFSGRYDVRCEECAGHGRVLIPIWDGHQAEAERMAEKIDSDRDYERDSAAERAAERAMGA